MKATFICAAAMAVLPNAVPALHIPAFLEPRQPQGPRCSLYSGFKDSASFTSLCRQLPRATKKATYTLQPTASSSTSNLRSAGSSSTTSSSTRWIPSISGEHFTFDSGQTSTTSPVDPAISSAANHSTYEMQNYTITPTGPLLSNVRTSSSTGLASDDIEVNCYLNGSKIPMSECTRTAGLTRHYGYTYTPSSRPATATTTSNSSGSVSSVESSSSVAGPTKSTSTNSPSSKGLNTTVSGVASSTTCTRTMNLTRHHGYTFSDTLTRVRPTASSISSPVASSSAASTSSSEANLSFDSAALSSSTLLASSTTLPSAVTSPSFYTDSSYDCSNATNPEPHHETSSAPVEPTTETPSLVTVRKTASSSSSMIISSSSASPSVANTFSTSFINSYDCNNITAAEPHRKTGSSAMESLSSACSAPGQSQSVPERQTTAFDPVGVNANLQQTSTTTVVDATVTEVVPCPTDVQTEEKRDAIFIRAAGEKLCDTGVYCVNSTFVSDAPPTWQWESVALRQGQICLEDNVFNTAWVEQQCACTGL